MSDALETRHGNRNPPSRFRVIFSRILANVSVHLESFSMLFGCVFEVVVHLLNEGVVASCYL